MRNNIVRAAAHDDYSVGAVGVGTVTDTTLAGNLALTAGNDGFDIVTAGTTLTQDKAFANGCGVRKADRGFQSAVCCFGARRD